MKNLLFMTMLSLVFSMQSSAQKKNKENAPEIVQTAFNLKFPAAKKLKWEMEKDTEWEAEFKMDGKEYSANFGLNGEWKETEYEIKKSDIPANIKAMLDQEFKDYKIENGEISESSAGISYEFEIEIGKEEFEVTIDPQGKITKKAEIEEDKDDDKN